MQIVERLCLGVIVISSDEVAAVLVSGKTGDVSISTGKTEEAGTFIPFPQPAFQVNAVMEDQSIKSLGYKIPGNLPIDWDDLLMQAEADRQAGCTRDFERLKCD
jgi:hypothetical protein